MNWKNKIVLVTGGTGFIGSFVVERLLDAGAKVRVPVRSSNYRALSERRAEIDWREGDLRDPDYCAELVDGIDELFHMASCRRNVKYHRDRCGDVAQENVRMTIALLEALKEKELSVPVTFFSTANVPPTVDPLALAQQEQVDGYVIGKSLAEALWFAASHQRKFPLLIVRPVGVYGPRDTFAEDGNVIPALMMKARSAKEALEVWGTGDEERAFIYVEDAVNAVFTLREAGAHGIQYISSGEVVTIRALAEQIRDLVHPGMPIVFKESIRLGARTIPLSEPHACLRQLSWTPFPEGLRHTYESWK
jgi:nucleoside-diphosphate-sugar epimerase